MKGKFFESDYEEALIDLLEQQGWTYTYGGNIARNNREVLISDDLCTYLKKRYSELNDSDIEEIINHLRFTSGQTHFELLRNTFHLIRDGYRYTRSSDGKIFDIEYLDFEFGNTNNSYSCINQFEVGYGLKADVRIPDVLLFINGIPLCIFELKNPTDTNATIFSAYEQIHNRYKRDIPHLLRYCPLSCISDATVNNTKLGTTYTPYNHYYAWKKVNNEDESAKKGIDQIKTIVAGVYEPNRFLEIIRDYVYFPDKNSDKIEEIVCRYPQFFATRLLTESVLKAHTENSRKGGTYFGATGCGKTYTMMFLARQLSLRCEELGSPTIVMIVDRDDLQTQAGKLFLRSEEFLSLGAAKIIADRQDLKTEMSIRKSGGFFICTIQKFCEEIGELNTRKNIICFSDEAHRTQVKLNKQLKIKDKKPETESKTIADSINKQETPLGAFVTKPYAEHLRIAFPNATFVGFTGTPIEETIQVFGEVVDSYTMQQSVDDDITVALKYIPRIANVTLDSQKVKEIDEYYKQCADEGATEDDVAASKKAMSAMEVILGDDERLERLAKDITTHYTNACENKVDVVQKAMIVCSKRKIAYRLLQKFRAQNPEWFEEKKSPDDSKLTKEELKKLPKMPTIAMVATRGANDSSDMYKYIGDKSRIKKLDDAFKMEHSNFRIVIVVDMWITGFDVPSLTYLYNDKPLQKQTLIQTISRVNRKYEGKKFGYVIDYIGIRENMMKAMRKFGGKSFGPSEDDVQQALEALIIELKIISDVFTDFDITPFTDSNTTPLERLECLSSAADYIITLTEQLNLSNEKGKPKKVSVKTFFMAHVRRLRTAYDICQPSNVLTNEQLSLSQCFMAVASYIRKTSGDKHDAESMNRVVEKMVAEALKFNSVVDILDTDVEENIFSPEFVEQLDNIKLPATKLEVLIKMLRKSIQEYKDTNKIAAEKFEELLNKTLDEYHNRRASLSSEEASSTQAEAVDSIIRYATQQALELMAKLGEDKDSFRKLGLTFEEKAFYDILMHLRDKYNFEYGEDKKVGSLIINDKCKLLAQKIKELIDMQSSFTDWLNNSNVRADLNQKIFFCLHKNGYPPQHNDEVFDQVMEQVENFKHNN
ncbi:HsdR family type I site-specific deoxyribonuclease [Flavobacteriaceae bacterium XHP0103]|uniref:type I restriction endonuclease subunit R n=1 Tax=Marixanthotalea marina TaxID=2844359 RepID=UPI002989D080|nr:HsdR family type I site-specific deoxyribonuclease [Marixanthotalea marina]MBU3821451.1 HsdR family type I site-specific deoxyribonuclease [Marixanthotalea marina]